MYTLNSEIGSGVDTVFLGNRFRRGYRIPKDIGSSVDTESHRESVLKLDTVFQEISSGVDTNIPGIDSGMDTISQEIGSIVNTVFQVKKSVPTWMPIFQRNRLQREHRYSKEIGSSVDTVSQEFSSGMDTDIPGKEISSGVDTNIPGFLWIFVE
uniref:Uncharacterized protein n=1 Tax=Rhizophagus irregularis (strain DAOM 181602 / DAOM 197198 / MUCL 43194) TaxID=747089 RepID=U9SP65_RHIID